MSPKSIDRPPRPAQRSSSSLDDSEGVRLADAAEQREASLLALSRAQQLELERLHHEARERAKPLSVPPAQKALLSWIGARLREQSVAISVSIAVAVAAAVRPQAQPAKVDAQGVTLDAVQKELTAATTELAARKACGIQNKAWMLADQAYWRAVMAKQGTSIPRTTNAVETPTLTFTVKAKTGRSVAGPTLEVDEAPPEPPNCQ